MAHASLSAYELCRRKRPEWVEKWKKEGQKKVVLKVASLKELLELKELAEREGIPCYLVKDAGLTQVEPGTVTALGCGPAPEEVIDKVFNRLKLL